MEGFHYEGAGGKFSYLANQVIAEVELEPGKYLVFGKGAAGVSAAGPSPHLLVVYGVTLELGDLEDSWVGSLKGEYEDPGDRQESFALNLAGEITKPTRARLRVNVYSGDILYVHAPRISAIKVGDLKIVSGEFEPTTFQAQEGAYMGLPKRR